MKLHHYGSSNISLNVRSYKDRRKKIDRYTIRYIDLDSYIYHKSFEFVKGTNSATVDNIIPKFGENSEITKFSKSKIFP